MNCKRAQSHIALQAGDDLEECECRALKRHLEQCEPCQEYARQMQSIMQVIDDCPMLEEADRTAKEAVEDSLWTTLSSQLVTLPPPQVDRFNGWVPAVAVAAVCFAMVLVASPQSSSTPDIGEPVAASTSASSSQEESPSPRPVPVMDSPYLMMSDFKTPREDNRFPRELRSFEFLPSDSPVFEQRVDTLFDQLRREALLEDFPGASNF